MEKNETKLRCRTNVVAELVYFLQLNAESGSGA